MNDLQQKFVDTALEGKNIFLTGSGGTGKSYVLKYLLTEFKKRNRHYALTAMTGCAALLLENKATTLHSWAGVGLGKEALPKLVSDIRRSSKAMRRWLLTDTLIIDEVSMMPPEFFEKLDAIAKRLRSSQKPFGGIQLIFVGDFFQLPPVNKEKEDKDPDFIFEIPLWKTMDFNVIDLKEIMRQKDPVFHEILNEARIGQLSNKSLVILKERQNLNWKKLEIKPTLLFPQRGIVNSINMQNLKKLQGDQYSYKVSTISATAVTQQMQYSIDKTNRDSSYEEELLLKVGAQVMLIINLPSSSETNLVNGSRGVVTGFSGPSHTPLVKFLGYENPIPIEHYYWEVADFEGVKQKQIPLRLAYALTIHKSQGSTLDSALIDVGPNTFEYGQAYVALSRVKDLESLYLWDIEKGAFKAHPKVIEFYRSMLK